MWESFYAFLPIQIFIPIQSSGMSCMYVHTYTQNALARAYVLSQGKFIQWFVTMCSIVLKLIINFLYEIFFVCVRISTTLYHDDDNIFTIYRIQNKTCVMWKFLWIFYNWGMFVVSEIGGAIENYTNCFGWNENFHLNFMN